jgi:hypothetical protein
MPGIIPTPEEKQRRLAVVERTIADRGWSLQIKRALAAQFGVSNSTVSNYRRELILSMRDELGAQELAIRRAEFVARIRGHQRAALDAGRLGPLAAMMNIEARITGIDRPPVEAADAAVMNKDELIDALAAELSPDHLAALQERVARRAH